MKKSTVTIICILIVILAVVIALSAQDSNSMILNGFGLKTTTAALTVEDYSGYYTTELEEIAYTIEPTSPTTSDGESNYSYAPTTYEPSMSFVKPIGRTIYQNGERWISMSGSGIEFNCDAEAIEITLLTENISYITYNHKPRVAIFADDCLVFDQALEKDETTVHIDLKSIDNNAVISVVKLSESMHSCCGIGTITVYGKNEITPTDDKALKIEFIGDSITCGYGIDEARNGKFSTRTENFAKSYAYLASKMLNADYSAIAFSGYGVVSGYTANNRRNEDAVIFKYYNKAITNKSFDDYSVASDEWDNSSFIPDVVVINLGTNDASYCRTAGRRAEFIGEYKRLIALVREKNPNSYILCVLGDMNNSLYPSIETAVDEYTNENFDEKITSTTIDFKMGENPVALSGHPGAESNLIAAQDLAEEIYKIWYAGKI